MTESEMLNDESEYDLDINNDGSFGDSISQKIIDGQNQSLYKTESNSFIIDTLGLDSGEKVNSPILLKTLTTRRGTEYKSLYSIKYTPSFLLIDRDGNFAIYFQDNRKRWFKDTFDDQGVHISLNRLSISQILNDESYFQKDIDNDGNIGEEVKEILSNVSRDATDSWGIYKTKSGALVLDNSNLNIGNYLEEPKLLTKIVRNKNYLYDLKYSVSGSIVLMMDLFRSIIK